MNRKCMYREIFYINTVYIYKYVYIIYIYMEEVRESLGVVNSIHMLQKETVR